MQKRASASDGVGRIGPAIIAPVGIGGGDAVAGFPAKYRTGLYSILARSTALAPAILPAVINVRCRRVWSVGAFSSSR
jgi:hypothetical protein